MKVIGDTQVIIVAEDTQGQYVAEQNYTVAFAGDKSKLSQGDKVIYLVDEKARTFNHGTEEYILVEEESLIKISDEHKNSKGQKN